MTEPQPPTTSVAPFATLTITRTTERSLEKRVLPALRTALKKVVAACYDTESVTRYDCACSLCGASTSTKDPRHAEEFKSRHMNGTCLGRRRVGGKKPA